MPIGQDSIQWLSEQGDDFEFDAEVVAGKFFSKSDGQSYTKAATLLKRLQARGLVRVERFADPAGGGAGRRRKVYRVTESGHRRAEWLAGRK